MKIAKPEQMAKIDKIAIEKYKIPSIVLMENAALCVLKEIKKTLNGLCSKKVVIFAGKGNNGGDAFAIARHLHNKGALVNIFLLGDVETIKGDARINLEILRKMGVVPTEINSHYTNINYMTNMMLFISEADIIIDGILGTGLKGKVKDITKDIIKIINESEKYILSIDIPSGLNGNTGEVMGECVKADKTVTFVLPKVGLFLYPGCEHAGEIIVADIGIPTQIIDSIDDPINNYILNSDVFSDLVPNRCKQTNKGDFGRAFIITGSPGMTGAGCLSAKAALRTGAGLVYIGVPLSLAHIYNIALAEAITISLNDWDGTANSKRGYLTLECIQELSEQIKNKNVIAIGPGLSKNKDIFGIVDWLIENSTVPLVLDADALNAISYDISILSKLKVNAVITPHPGEMSRLCGISVDEIQNNRIEIAREFACRWKVITVLKGWRTVIAFPDGTVFINTSGNPGMATAGTGDVLTGIITGLIAQGLTPEQAAVAGTFMHGIAGDRVSNRLGEHGLIAGDIVEEIPYVTRNLRSLKNTECY